MIAYLIVTITKSFRDHRRREARRVFCTVPRLGDFSSADNRFWDGEKDDLLLTIESVEGPPTQDHAEQVLDLFKNLEILTQHARKYFLAQNDGKSWIKLEPGDVEPCGLWLYGDSSFQIDFRHPADEYVGYWVIFKNGLPVSSGWDD
ncbi:hypothetical protein KIH39_20575 [Telmatocola sphagniphila]|uniref:Uncharacterized protein n=1 Tax=Telmatocola sphagniphila TaxID=1123043 RepID=A0A8E6B6C3_9BACT|nr:hypothetical protein [Telmatocola sphagniphila]QVL31220.1 hypothetical protein KIH39_20575 [Telmatocola sphagniphila]